MTLRLWTAARTRSASGWPPPPGDPQSPLAVEAFGLEAVGDAAQAEAQAGPGRALGDAGEAGDLTEGPALEVGEQDGGALGAGSSSTATRAARPYTMGENCS
jgi:hypothetical protein